MSMIPTQINRIEAELSQLGFRFRRGAWLMRGKSAPNITRYTIHERVVVWATKNERALINRTLIDRGLL